MNMETTTPSAPAAAKRETIELLTWSAALADYRAKRAVSDAIPPNGEGEDEAVDAYAIAMDHLIEAVPAPGVAALKIKQMLIEERWVKDSLTVPSEVWGAFCRDVDRLAGSESLLLQLSARYQAIWDAHDMLDKAQPAEGSIDGDPEAIKLFYACQRSMGELADESLMIERLILRQVPRNEEELTVQALHASSLYDGGHSLKGDDRKAITVAFDNIINFLVSEGRVDLDSLGPISRSTAMHSWERCQFREGAVEA